jgi:hypothetical protein
MSEFRASNPQGIDIYAMPGYTEHTSFAEIVRFFCDQIPGKTLTIHHASPHGHAEFSSLIHWSGVLENGKVAIVAEDAFQKPVIHEFDGQRTDFIGSIYEENDVWFTEDGDTWFGIYDDPISELVIRRLEE